ncbi:MAG: FtsX-like permease family protein [Anaerolineales bacterium]
MFHLEARWRKILNDMWANKPRTMLVVLSIAVGVAAVGMVSNGWIMIQRDLYGPFQKAHPHSVLVNMSPFDESIVSAVEGMPEIARAAARRVEQELIFSESSAEEEISLHAIPDLNDVRVDEFTLEQGSLPERREILLERMTAELLAVQPGDRVTVEVRDGTQYELVVSGVVHDLNIVAPRFFDISQGYLNMETLTWMGFRPYYNRLDLIVSENGTDSEHVLAVAAKVRDRILEPEGYRVYGLTFGPFASSAPEQYWAERQLDGMAVVFHTMSIVSILLSSGLVINTISAIVTQQIKQIGMMRSVGASRRQMVTLYVVNVLIFSLIALAIAIPAGLLGAWWLASFVGDIMNFDIITVSLPAQVVILQVSIGLLIPVVAGLLPIISGTRISVYDAIYQYGVSRDQISGSVTHWISRVHSLSRPVLLAVRNTFRRKARLIFTLATLTLAGAMFIAVFSTRESMGVQIDEVARYLLYDVAIGVSGQTNQHTAEREALRVEGVTLVESRINIRGRLQHPDGSGESELQLIGVPYDDQTIDPFITQGRWLTPEDTVGVVINEDVLDDAPWLTVGSTIRVDLGGYTREFEVVGITTRQITSAIGYVSYRYLTKLTGRQNQVDEVRVRTSPYSIADISTQRRIADDLEDQFESAGIPSSAGNVRNDVLANISDVFDILLVFLLIMAGILASVGGLGLAGTMSMNVIERTREIGVLRAVGASNRDVRHVVLIEGMTVGLLSWSLAILASFPVGKALSNAVGYAVFLTTPPYKYSLSGVIGWLVLAVLISAVASLGPAQRASRLTVREVLAYE